MADDVVPIPAPRPRRTVPIDFTDLEMALEDSQLDHFWYLDTETGDVIFISEFYGDEESDALKELIDNDESGRYIDIPRAESGEDYRDMADWTATVESDRLRDDLWEALEGHRPFRHFRAVLNVHAAKEKEWYAFKRQRVLQRGRDWLESEGIEPIPVRQAGDDSPIGG